MKVLLASVVTILLLIPVLAASQTCLTSADIDCNNEVNITELLDYIDEWYACSECVPDLFNAIQAYYGIPFCGDNSCDGGVGEDCLSCPQDCGSCATATTSGAKCLIVESPRRWDIVFIPKTLAIVDLSIVSRER